MPSNSKIAKNTIILYFRMIFSMLVSLYTGRVVLQQLGAEDFGVNNVVAGVVGMFSFLNASMGSATSRFLSYAIGKHDNVELEKTIQSAKAVHFLIAVVVTVLAETIGMYFLNTKLVIAENRIFAANFVFQMCILSTVFTITQVPYTALVFSYEKMSAYACIEIVNTLLKLIAVFFLTNGTDKLMLWGVLTAVLTVLISLTYRVYCWVCFKESRNFLSFEKNLVKPMLSFSGLDLYGNLSVMARTQGVNMLLNMFFGPLMNAAAGVATTVQSAVMSLSSNVITAMRPQIVKRYAVGEIDSMLGLLSDVEKIGFLLISVLTVPLIVENDFVLSLWLGNVPNCASQICIFVLLFNIFANQSMILLSVIHATGKIFRPSVINGSLYLLVVPISYISFKFGGDYWTSFLFNVFAVFAGLLSNAWTVQLHVPKFSFKKYVFKSLTPCLVTFVAVASICYGIKIVLPEGIYRLALIVLCSSILLIVFGGRFMLSNEMRASLVEKVKLKLCRNH